MIIPPIIVIFITIVLSTLVHILKQIKHNGDVNRARYMPRNQSIIASKTVGGEIHIFDSSKHPYTPPVDGVCSPDLRLRGHEGEGFGLSWNPFKEGHLLSCSDDAMICLWDINANPSDKILGATRMFNFHRGPVEDVAWHLNDENLFGSVGDDKYLRIWDLRIPTTTLVQSVVAHDREINAIAFNHLNEWAVATGSSDCTAKVFDLRRILSPHHTLKWHQEEVFDIGWNPNNENVLASSCSDRRISVWDLSRVGNEQTPEEAIEGPPELLFVHGGHTSRIADFSWNHREEWLMASADTDNQLHIWQMAQHVYYKNCDLPHVDVAASGSLPLHDDASDDLLADDNDANGDLPTDAAAASDDLHVDDDDANGDLPMDNDVVNNDLPRNDDVAIAFTSEPVMENDSIASTEYYSIASNSKAATEYYSAGEEGTSASSYR